MHARPASPVGCAQHRRARRAQRGSAAHAPTWLGLTSRLLTSAPRCASHDFRAAATSRRSSATRGGSHWARGTPWASQPPHQCSPAAAQPVTAAAGSQEAAAARIGGAAPPQACWLRCAAQHGGWPAWLRGSAGCAKRALSAARPPFAITARACPWLCSRRAHRAVHTALHSSTAPLHRSARLVQQLPQPPPPHAPAQLQVARYALASAS